jgi:CO dehydrogenase/acetyl-CoA synthase gamma subunit (corrinoid Fe-S protein)
VDRARPVTREYDQFGQEIRPPAAAGAGSPVYLIAFNDHVIRAAVSYFVDGRTLHYVTLEREERQVPIDTVDRALSLQLNRERQVPFQLPAVSALQ